MTLGARIYRLRTERGLSQETLADQLGVSRQSVSKWETDGAVPELDKLLKLSQVFGLTLDQLVRGEEPQNAVEDARLPEPAAPPAPKREGRIRAAVVLLVVGAVVTLLGSAMGSLLLGLLFASPILVSAAICFLVNNRPGLWCGWAVYLMVDLYLRYGTGLHWRVIFLTAYFTPEMNYLRLATGWCQFLAMVLMMALTLWSFRRVRLTLSGGGWALLGLGWAVAVAAHMIHLPDRTFFALFHRFLGGMLDEVRLAMVVVLLVLSLGAWRGRRKRT